MKRILIAIMIGALFGSLLTGLASLASANASGPVTTAASPAQATAPQVAPVAASVAVVAPVAVVGAEFVDPPQPHPEGKDPVLGTRKWGTRSSRVKGARGSAVTSDLHSDVEIYENGKLAEQQSSELLDIFRDSKGVLRLIEQYGGDPDHTTFYVREISADEDYAGNSTPWVTATLRADFASPEGLRGIEMQVYRNKMDKDTLDNTPYVASTQVGYLDLEGDLSRQSGYPAGHDPDELRSIRFKN